MRAKEILDRGVQEVACKDETFSYAGKRDFKEESPTLVKLGPKPANSRLRTKASQNNSYS
jgi:hypothetical protein